MDGNSISLNIGVLALQGAFVKHCEMLKRLGVAPVEVRYQEQLANCQGLIIPGGESTTISQQLVENRFSLTDFNNPIFGTCAGLILLAAHGLLDITVQRNAYGRQLHSFSAEILFNNSPLPAFFIRAPRITSIHSSKVKILATHQKNPVLVQQGIYLASTFHPELTENSTIHNYFIEICKKKQLLPQPSRTTPIKSFQTI